MKTDKKTRQLYDLQNKLWESANSLVLDLVKFRRNWVQNPDAETNYDDDMKFRDNYWKEFELKERRRFIGKADWISIQEKRAEESLNDWLADESLKERNESDRQDEKDERCGDFDEIEQVFDPPLTELYHEEQILKELNVIRGAIANRDVDIAAESLNIIVSHAEESPLVLEQNIFEELQEKFDEIDNVTPRLLYRGAKELIKRPAQNILLEISSILVSEVTKDPNLLHSLTSRQFEEFVAELFDKFGYFVELTAQTRDRGRDIIAIRTDHGILSKLLIECKRFSPNKPVGVSYVRELYGVKAIERATKAILATTSYFSPDARLIEKQLVYELELKDFDAVSAWAREYSKFINNFRFA